METFVLGMDETDVAAQVLHPLLVGPGDDNLRVIGGGAFLTPQDYERNFRCGSGHIAFGRSIVPRILDGLDGEVAPTAGNERELVGPAAGNSPGIFVNLVADFHVIQLKIRRKLHLGGF